MASILFLLSLVHLQARLPTCTCVCSDGAMSPKCTKCHSAPPNLSQIDAPGDCSHNTNYTCWHYLINNQYDYNDIDVVCILDRIYNGQYQTRPDCCSSMYTTKNSSLLPYSISVISPSSHSKKFVTNDVYVKDSSGNFIPYVPPPLPVIDFPGLAALALNGSIRYDNNTCSGRCCKKAVLNKKPIKPRCDDWKSCAVLNSTSDYPPCTAAATTDWTRCTAWVPCDMKDQNYISPIYITLLSFLLCCYIFLVYAFIPMKWQSITFCFWLVYFIVYTVVILCAVSSAQGFLVWIGTTEVNMDYIAYQSCVDYCNQNENVVMDKFCNDVGPNPYALFPADNNTHLAGGACPSSDADENVYCASCLDHTSDWTILRDAALFSVIRGIVGWFLFFVLRMFAANNAYSNYLDKMTGTIDEDDACVQDSIRMVIILNMLFSVVSIGFEALYINRITRWQGLQYMDKAVRTDFPLLGISQSFLTFDIVFIVFSACLGWHMDD